MMLQAFLELADREGLGDADFEKVGVRWMIPLNEQGQLKGTVIQLFENPEDKKSRPQQMLRPFTSPNELNQGTKSYFLCDTLERAALFLDPKSPEKAPARVVQHQFFKSLLEEASKFSEENQKGLKPILRFINDKEALTALHSQLIQLKAKPTDTATFSVNHTCILELESARDFWRRRRQKSGVSDGKGNRICIATGTLGETLNTTEKVKGVPGGLATGTNLISFDKDSFCSYGLEQAQNAALSPLAELKIRASLNHLIEKSREQRLVFNDTIHLHWSRRPLDNDPVDLLTVADPEAISGLLRSVKSGNSYTGLNNNDYYCLSLSGNGARIVVRNWLESTVSEVARNIALWFENLSIILPDGSGIKNSFKFYELLKGMVRAEIDELSPQLPTQIFHAALNGRVLPHHALATALQRQRLDQDDRIKPARIALIKACLKRLPSSINPNEHMTDSLNPNSTNPAYLCGRLFAVFDRLQFIAQGAVNSGVVERYYASASVTPALVMGRLFRNAQFHLAKTEGGTATNVGKDFESITTLIGNQFPATLNLEEQGRFALGYYQQKAEYRRRSTERKEADAKLHSTQQQ